MTSRGASGKPPRQTIGFVRGRDGARIAYASSGEGPVVVKTANWLSHLEYDWRSPVWRHWLDFLGARHRLVRYDERGNGLSDRELADLSFETRFPAIVGRSAGDIDFATVVLEFMALWEDIPEQAPLR